MPSPLPACLLTALLLFPIAGSAAGSPPAGPAVNASGAAPAAALAVAAAQGWIARASDNVCGLSNPRQLSNPALVDFPLLLSETEEIKRLRRERIDPESPQGIQLRNAANSRVAGACQTLMVEQSHCSVWKAIRHSDGREVADLTEQVRLRL